MDKMSSIANTSGYNGEEDIRPIFIKPEWKAKVPDETVNVIDRHLFDLHNELRQNPKIVILDL
jgi:hypothetical protein